MDSAGELPALHPAPPQALWEASVGKRMGKFMFLHVQSGVLCASYLSTYFQPKR